jgi:hypothetical protein
VLEVYPGLSQWIPINWSIKVSDAQLAAVNISRHASTVSGIIQPRQRARIFLAKKVMDSHNPPLTRRSVMSDGFLR